MMHRFMIFPLQTLRARMAGFQAKAAAAFGRAGGTGAKPPPAVKGFMRMHAKLGTDHADAYYPQPYENADTNGTASRGCWRMPTSSSRRTRCKHNYQVSHRCPSTRA